MKLPLYQALIDDEMDGITAISLVTEGAVEVDFLMFDKNKELKQFAIQDEEQRLLLGCVMRCDFPIYRRNGDFEYYIQYNRETIEKMATKMLKDHSFVNIDLEHDGMMLPQGMVELREIFIKDTEKGIVPRGFDDVNDGSLFAVYKVNNDEIWDLCKQGIFNSFSLEGYFNTVEVKAQKEDKKKETIMNKIKTILTKLLAEFASVNTDKGEIFYEGELAVGVEIADADGNAVEDGEYVTDDNIIVVADGKVAEIKEKETEEEPAAEEEEVEEVEAEEEEVVVEEPAEPAYDAKAEVEALKAEVEALKSEIEAIKNKLAEPANEPIVEEFKKVSENKSTGNKKLDRMVEIARALNK